MDKEKKIYEDLARHNVKRMINAEKRLIQNDKGFDMLKKSELIKAFNGIIEDIDDAPQLRQRIKELETELTKMKILRDIVDESRQDWYE